MIVSAADPPGAGATGDLDDVERRWPRWATVAVAAYAALLAVTGVFGRTLLDEGFYVRAGARVLSGDLPYRDFLFTQAPLASYLFAPAALAGRWGLQAGRLLCALMGLCAVVLTLKAALRMGGRAALGMVLVLLLGNASFAYDMCVARLGAPTALLVAGALLAVSGESGDGRRWTLAMALLSLGVGVRLSFAAPLLIVWGAAVWRWRAAPARCLRLTAAAVVPAGLVLAPFALAGGDRFFVDVIDFHNLYYGRDHAWPLPSLAHRFFVDATIDHATIVLAGVAAATALMLRRRRAPGGIMLCAWCGVLVLHATRTAPFAYHQTMFLPLVACPVGVALGTVVRGAVKRRAIMLALIAVGLVVAPRQDLPLRFGAAGSLGTTRRAGELIHAAGRGGSLLALDPSLAVAAGVPLLPGYDMGIFGYWPDAEGAEHFGARSARDVQRDLEHPQATVVALTDEDIAHLAATEGSSAIVATLGRHWAVSSIVPGYGQYQRPLTIYTVR